MFSIVSSLTPKAAASSGPINVFISDVAPTKNCGLFFFAEVVNPKKSSCSLLDAIWLNAKYLGTKKTSPSFILVSIALLPFGNTI
ncbi:hypothetical protein P8452_53652 [Trifolium repens]|nr:hypothetical protein P8452_53652 [Trifolium repens]